ncbi:MAG TPA: class I SAM-dependent methyltransferase [Bdellovibrionota bacterium]|nr:class I SAM-dependent methyltransferase [Bdellovibrionota bacterium]
MNLPQRLFQKVPPEKAARLVKSYTLALLYLTALFKFLKSAWNSFVSRYRQKRSASPCGLVEHKQRPHVCPWWLGYLLISPIRRWFQKPEKILEPHLNKGMTVLDLGCGMGFFTLEMARIVGPGGKVVAVDLQPKMLSGLKRRAAKAGLLERIDLVQTSENSLALSKYAGQIDFVLAMAMVHEVPSAKHLFEELHAALKPAARVLVAEPAGHVKETEFGASVLAAEEAGFQVVHRPGVARSRSVLLEKIQVV